MLYNFGCTNTVVIYCHSTIITKVILLYDTECGIAVNYRGKKFYNIGPWYWASVFYRASMPVADIKKTLAYYKMCPILVNYESAKFYSAGPGPRLKIELKNFVKRDSTFFSIKLKILEKEEKTKKKINVLTLFRLSDWRRTFSRRLRVSNFFFTFSIIIFCRLPFRQLAWGAHATLRLKQES